MSNFAELKRKSQSNFDFLQKELQKSTNANSSGDERLWKPALDASGNGYAVVRFLPAPEGESLPWAKLYNHAFQGPGGWFIENSLTTLGQQDPVSAANNKLWNSGVESDKEIARVRKRKLSYYSNIYVIKDSANPDNEGKVFLYKYGKKIWDKIEAQMNPEFEDETKVNPFDMWQGADFKLKIRKVAGYRNYDSSEFESPAPLLEDDERLETIWNKQHGLNEFVEPANFKSYDELKQKLDRVLGKTVSTATAADTVIEQEESSWEPTESSTSTPLSQSPQVGDDDDDMSFFKKLAEED